MSAGLWKNARCYEQRFSVTAALSLVRLAKCSCEKSFFEWRSYCHAGQGRWNERERLFVKCCDMGRVSWLRDSSAHCGGSYRFSVLEGKIHASVTIVTVQTQLQRLIFFILACRRRQQSTLPSSLKTGVDICTRWDMIGQLAIHFLEKSRTMR